MSVINNPLLLGQEGGGGYAISRSLRFNSSDSAYLSRTPASAGNRRTWTLSLWVKRGAPTGSDIGLFSTYSGSNPATTAYFNSNDGITFYNYSGSYQFRLITTQVFRDYSAWCHFIFVVDTTQATASNRVKFYVNGSQVTTFSTETYPSQNVDTDWNSTTEHQIGNHASYFTGYLADIHFIDGQALDPTSFGEFADNGIWQPIAYSGSYGTNGFHLDFSDNSTAAALGTDSSGLGNTWTVNNLSVTAGAGNDSLVDVPTNGAQTDTGAGGEVRGNYCTWNPLHGNASTLSNGNLDYSAPSIQGVVRATIALPQSGKWYWEVIPGNDRVMAGIEKTFSPYTGTYPGGNTNGYGYAGADGLLWFNASGSAFGSTYGSGDVVGVAYDADNGRLFFSKNNTWQNSSNPVTGSNPAASGLTGSWTPCIGRYNGSPTASTNFGQRPFAYTAPSGFKALNTASLPAPLVTKPSTVMDVKLYTGNGSTQTISGLGFSPDLVWIKDRQSAFNHTLTDSVRGDFRQLYTNTTGAEEGPYTNYVSLTSDGFSVGNGAYVNTTGKALVAWTWDAGSSTVTNTQGSISSQVRANASAGFSIVTYTGAGGNATVGHGLGIAPSLVIVKSRVATANMSWAIYHRSLGAGYWSSFSTDASTADGTTWNSTNPTSSVFSIGGYSIVNENTKTYVAYCFAPVAGYANAFSFTGNGSSDGPMVWLGFRPRLILLKRTDSTSYWHMYDTARNTYNVADANLWANGSDAEISNSAYNFDLLSNGFKVRTSDAARNASGGTYVGFAWAESPFQYARAR